MNVLEGIYLRNAMNECVGGYVWRMRSKQALEGFAIDQSSKEKFWKMWYRDILFRCPKKTAAINRMLPLHRETGDE
jgi:hypothetical protein